MIDVKVNMDMLDGRGEFSIVAPGATVEMTSGPETEILLALTDVAWWGDDLPPSRTAELLNNSGHGQSLAQLESALAFDLDGIPGIVLKNNGNDGIAVTLNDETLYNIESGV